jgi:3-dehydroquinate synthase
MRRVHVSLGERSYDISIGRNLLSGLGNRCRKAALSARCAIISDETVAPLFGPQVIESLTSAGFDPVLVAVPAGEKSKSTKTVAACYDRLASHRLERKSFVVALGGGVVGDLAGFVAATYLRGIPFVQVPTTLLAQVDSSVGGKVGVNLPAGKNLVGSFHQPRFVLCDLDTIDSLPDREFRAGLAEVIKYGIIYDAALFRLIERKLPEILAKDGAELTHLVARSCAIKADVVGQDETETGLRAILNFGHTIGHAIENVSGYGRYLHGEAISIGQIAAAHLSSQVKGLPKADVDRIHALFVRACLPAQIRITPALQDRLLAAMRVDKKVTAGEIRFVLASAIGKVEWGCRVPEEAVVAALQKVNL